MSNQRVNAPAEIGRFFDRECCGSGHPDVALDFDLDPLSNALLTALAKVGFGGARVLEIGSGDGMLSRELLRRGAASVSGLDLSPQSVSYARARAESAGTGDRLSYRVADASTASLEPHDAVVSEKVFCCFPDPAGLLANSLPAARSLYALVLPESAGLMGFLTRLEIGAENAWRWLRGDGFRAYVHDIGPIDRTIRAAGFDQRVSRRHATWRILIYSRA